MKRLNLRKCLYVAGLGIIVGVYVLVSGCELEPQDARTEYPKKDSLTPVSVRLGWVANANSAGQIVAKQLGFYREEGLDVSLHDGGLVDPSVRTVAAGVDTIGFANGPELVIAARRAGAPLRIFGVIHAKGYHVFCAKEGSGVRTPADWVGKRIGVKVGSPTYLQYRVLSEIFGVEASRVQEIPLGRSLQPFLVDQVDVYPGATTNELVSLNLRGVHVHCISAEDFGVPTLGNVMFATEKTTSAQAPILRRFLRATMRGWSWCRDEENRPTVVELLVARNARLDPIKEAIALEETLKLVGDGAIDRDRMSRIIQYQEQYSSTSGHVDVETVVVSEEVLSP